MAAHDERSRISLVAASILTPIIVASVLTVFCGHGGDAALLKDDPVVDPVIVLDQQLVFSRDARPADGKLIELTLSKDSSGKYDATLRTAFYSRAEGRLIDESEQIAQGLSCVLYEHGYICNRDDRPVDGALVELSLGRNQDDTYNAQLFTAFVDRMNSTPIEEVKQLATNLIKTAPVARDYTAEAETYMETLTASLIEKVWCFSHEETFNRYDIKIYETTDPNFKYVLRYEDKISDSAPIFRAAASDLATIATESQIRLRLSGNYGPLEIWIEDGQLTADKDVKGFYRLIHDFGIESRGIQHPASELSCKSN